MNMSELSISETQRQKKFQKIPRVIRARWDVCSSSRQPWIWFQVTFPSHWAFRLTFHCLATLMLAAQSPSTAEVRSLKDWISQIEILTTESLFKVKPLILWKHCTAQSLSETQRCTFPPNAFYRTDLNEFWAIKLFASFITQTLFYHVSEIISMNCREIEEPANIPPPSLLRNNILCQASNLR